MANGQTIYLDEQGNETSTPVYLDEQGNPAPNAGMPAQGGKPLTIRQQVNAMKQQPKPIDKLINWFKSKREESEQRHLKDAAAGKVTDYPSRPSYPGEAPAPTASAEQFFYGMGEDTTQFMKDALSLKSLATVGATMAAPEVMVPYLGYQSGKQMLTPRQPGETAPESTQRRLLGAAGVAGTAAAATSMVQGGLANTTTTGKVIKKVQAARQVAADTRFVQDLQNAIPPTKTNQWSETDLNRARPYLVDEHGAMPVEDVGGFVDAADNAVGRIETKMQSYIDANPTDTINGHAKPVQAVRNALKGSPVQGFAEEGLKSIKKYNVSDDMTVQQAEAVRKQLNAENKAAMKTKNNYDRANMRVTDPEFAAREALANSLRDGVYGKLEQRGIQGVRELRQDEGALLRMRDAAEAKRFSATRKVGGTSRFPTVSKIIRRGSRAAGAGIGAAKGGVHGAIAGEVVGEAVGNAVAPGAMTRDALVKRAFGNLRNQPGSSMPTVPAKPVPAGQLPQRAATTPLTTPAPGESAQTAGEQATAKAAQASAQKPSVRIVRDPKTGRMMRQYLTAGEGQVYYEEAVTPTSKMKPSAQTRPNASGESAASQEAVNRLAAEKSGGIRRYRVDTRSGNEVPLVGVDAVDAKAGPYDVIIKRGPKGEEVLDTGSKARPYKRKGGK